MRTMHTLKSNVQAKVDYYEEDESLIDAQERYYGESESVSEVDRMTRAVWAGTAAKKAGLEGGIIREDFKTVLRGSLPRTNERIRWENPNPETKERLAHDVVLSAPKSISMALHLEGDVRIFDAHMESVLETLAFIEQEAAQTRIQVSGVRSVVQTGNLIAALIPHHTSRDGDMQLHTHMLVMNGTEGPDGVWRSLCHESLASAEWVGSYYRQKLSEKVQGLGYRIYETKDGFELEGYDREQLEVFSKRNRAIVKSVMAEGLEVNPENKKAAVLTTRKAKSGVGQKLEDVQAHWRAEAIQAGIGVPLLDRPHEVRGSLAKGVRELESAIRHLSESSVSFSRSDIYAYAFSHIHREGLRIEQLNQAIAERKDLIHLKNGRMTTVDALEREVETLELWKKGQGKAAAFMTTEQAQTGLMGSSLNSGQHEAVLRVASATDRHLIIQGLSGVGKTHALGELKRLIEASGQNNIIKGYSPTINAAQELQEALDIDTSTVESLVRRATEPQPNQLWIIDEAGMVSGEQMLSIVKKAEQVGARILLVGDTGQNPSVKAGSPMRSLMYNGATTFRLSEIIRQQNSMQKRAVELIANGQAVDALRVLNEHGYVEEVPSQRERVQGIAQDYLALDLTERSKTLIVTGTNAERQAITQAIRAGMKAEGSLGQERRILQLTNQYMSEEEKRRIENFEPGTYVQLLQDYKTTPLVKKKLYQVIGRAGDELVVSSGGGRLYRFDPSQYGEKEVYKAEEFAVAVGDRLRWTTSDRKAGQINGKTFTVIGVAEEHLIVADQQGTKIIELKQPLGVDYALVSTSYRAQGQTAKRVIVSATNGPTASKEPFYVKISRQTHEIKVYAEDIERLKDWVQRSIAQDNALELIGESYDNQQPGSEARPDHSAKRGTTAAEPDIADPERELEPPGQGGDEYDAAPGEGAAEQLHRGVHRGNEPAEIRQDGGLNRQVDAGDEQSGDEVRGLESGEPSDEYAGRRVSRPDQADLQPASQEWTGESSSSTGPESTDPEAIESWSREQFASLAEAVKQLQDENALSAAVGGRLAELSAQVVNLSSSQDGQTFEGMTKFAAIASEQLQILEASELSAKVETLLEQVQAVVTESYDSTQFEGMDALASAVLSQLQQTDLEKAIAEVGAELAQLSEGLTYAIRQDRSAVIGAAIKQWRTEQLISNAVLQDKQIDATQGWAGMTELAQAIAHRHAETAIAEYLEQFDSFCEQIQQSLIQRLDLQELGQAVRTLRSMERPEGVVSEQLQDIAQRLRDMDISPTPKPIKRQVFWQPDYATAERPDFIEPHHWEEFKRSAIHPDLIWLNVESLSGADVYERLLSERLAQMGTGQYVTQPMARLMAQYESLTEGGWWGKAGIDARSLVSLELGQQPRQNPWGCFKGDHPRIDQDKSDRKGEVEYIKYENPLGTSRSLYLANVPDRLAERIYEKHRIEPTEAEKTSGFWSVVHRYNLPITITEGAKKSWAALSQGEIAIGLAGVNALYRAKDENGDRLPSRQLNDEMAIFTEPLVELELFASPGREFRFAFDQDSKTSTVFNVRRELIRGVELLEARGCQCNIVKWNSDLGKGLDDLIANQGPQAFVKAIAQATSAEREKRIYYRTEYNALLRQVRADYPEATPELLDAEVYLRAIAKGETQDGERFLSQSDQARSLKDPGQIAAYIDQVKTTVPTLRQWKQEREATQEQQQETPIVPAPITPPIAPPALELAQPEMPAAQPQPIAQQQRPTQPKPPAMRPAPINAITDRQKAEERVALAAASVKQQLRGQYDEIAQQVMAKLGSVPPEVIDLEVFLKNASNPEEAKRLIQVGDTMSALRDSSSDFHGSYFDAIMRVAPAYEAIKNDPDAKMNYRHMALIVTNTNAKLKLEKNPEPTIRRKKEREDELTL